MKVSEKVRSCFRFSGFENEFGKDFRKGKSVQI